MGFYDQNLKGVDWTPLEQEQHRNPLIHALDIGRLDLGRAATDYFRPTGAYLKQVCRLTFLSPRASILAPCTACNHP